MIGDTITSATPKIYVYRDDGNGNPIGKNIRAYTPSDCENGETVETVDLERDLGPGIYILMAGNGLSFAKRRVFVGDPGADVAAGAAGAAGDTSELAILSRMERMMRISTMAKVTTPAPDGLDMLEKVMGMIGRFTGGGAGGELENFFKGVDYAGDAGETNPLATAIETLAANAGKGGESDTMKQAGIYIAALSKQQREMQNEMSGLREMLSAVVKRMDRPDAAPDMDSATIADAVTGALAGVKNLEEVTTSLADLNTRTNGMVRRYLQTADRDQVAAQLAAYLATIGVDVEAAAVARALSSIVS